MVGEMIGVFFLVFGLFFSAIGVLGLMRFPDVYTRIHASGKVSTMGLMGLLLGAAFLMPETTLPVIVLEAFILLTSPVASHTIASAASRTGVSMKTAVRDDLADSVRDHSA